MQIRDRVRELRRVKASLLRPNPRNWRTHPPRQRDALRGVLAEIGYADALIARQLDDGTFELIDGHLRAETTPDVDVPVLVVDLTADEAAKLLLTLDPLAGLAETDPAALADLAAVVTTSSEALQAMIDELTERFPSSADERSEPNEIELKPLYQVVVECADEDEQRAVFEQLQAEGRHCRVLTL